MIVKKERDVGKECQGEPLKDQSKNERRSAKKKDGGLLGKMTRKPLNLAKHN